MQSESVGAGQIVFSLIVSGRNMNRAKSMLTAIGFSPSRLIQRALAPERSTPASVSLLTCLIVRCCLFFIDMGFFVKWCGG